MSNDEMWQTVNTPKINFLIFIARLARNTASEDTDLANYSFERLYQSDILEKVNEYRVGHEYNTIREIALRNLATLFEPTHDD